MGYYSVVKNNETMKCAGKWMELEIMFLSEVTQAKPPVKVLRHQSSPKILHLQPALHAKCSENAAKQNPQQRYQRNSIQ